MTTAAKAASYRITPANGTGEYQVRADSYEYDAPTGRHLFKLGDETVANLLNVSVLKLS